MTHHRQRAIVTDERGCRDVGVGCMAIMIGLGVLFVGIAALIWGF